MKTFFDKRSYLPGSPAARLHRHTMTPRFQVFSFSYFYFSSISLAFLFDFAKVKTVSYHTVSRHEFTPPPPYISLVDWFSLIFRYFAGFFVSLSVGEWCVYVSTLPPTEWVVSMMMSRIETRAKTDPCETMIASNVKKSNLARGAVTLRERIPIG